MRGPYVEKLKKVQEEIEQLLKSVEDLSGVKESDTGLAPPAEWNFAADKLLRSEKPLDVSFLTMHFNC